ncbi:nucleoside/nucleotide kinase family protein [Rhodococcus sp. WMMA185]|uniref:nucleoside/nucleotide kinase family protein n=1 Tax=Rhodococcus sp. WMMA185 TaxID=679318 RepID=UPI000878B641|nr:nucleoside/nucleotide kinase family protein [Rhodococcus sp. WMMA185]AOW92006.1 nucleoside/nucleotide kinase family protein [Rhodococcus sp. WMMA185]
MDELADRARTMIAGGQRRLLGITGSPGAGKSTLSRALVASLGEQAALVGMDGFHLANDELLRLGRRDRKGAPDTFDVDGYVALLKRLRHQQSPVIYAPTFDRGLEEPIGSAVAVYTGVPLVVTEGNYLLTGSGGWERVHPVLDEVWFLDVPHRVREGRLIGRHQAFGKTLAQAREWVREVDLRNADLVEAMRARADLVVEVLDDLSHEDSSW